MPASPSSSPTVERMKSELAAKPIRSELPWPSPVPRVPPEPKASRASAALLAGAFGLVAGEGVEPGRDALLDVGFEGGDADGARP